MKRFLLTKKDLLKKALKPHTCCSYTLLIYILKCFLDVYLDWRSRQTIHTMHCCSPRSILLRSGSRLSRPWQDKRNLIITGKTKLTLVYFSEYPFQNLTNSWNQNPYQALPVPHMSKLFKYILDVPSTHLSISAKDKSSPATSSWMVWAIHLHYGQSGRICLDQWDAIPRALQSNGGLIWTTALLLGLRVWRSRIEFWLMTMVEAKSILHLAILLC